MGYIAFEVFDITSNKLKEGVYVNAFRGLNNDEELVDGDEIIHKTTKNNDMSTLSIKTCLINEYSEIVPKYQLTRKDLLDEILKALDTIYCDHERSLFHNRISKWGPHDPRKELSIVEAIHDDPLTITVHIR